MGSLRIDAITYAPTVFRHCQHCEVTFQEIGLGVRLRRAQAADALPDDLAREYQALSDWSHELGRRFGARVLLRVVDAASIEGVLLSLRYRVFRYPAVVVDGRERFSGTDLSPVMAAVERRLRSAGGGDVAGRRPGPRGLHPASRPAVSLRADRRRSSLTGRSR